MNGRALFRGNNPRAREDAARLNDLYAYCCAVKRAEEVKGFMWLLGNREYAAVTAADSPYIHFDPRTGALSLLGIPVIRCAEKETLGLLVKPARLRS